jgi:two-component system NtrC family sensor kinase
MRLRLLTKFTLVTSGALLLAMVVFSWVNVRSLKAVFLEEAIKDVDNLSETIIQTTYYQMLEDDRKRVYQMIREVGNQKGVEHIRLINKDGIIIFSTEKTEIGTVLDKKAEACNMCHGGKKPLLQASSMSRSRVFRDRKGKEVLGIAKGIYSDPSCLVAACHFHPPEAKLLGVLDVIVSLEDMNGRMTNHRNGIVVLTFSLLSILLLSLTALTQRFIHRPVEQLLDHTRKLAQGDLESRIEPSSGDELGELAASFNVMALNLKKAHDELREWAATLEIRVEERTEEIRKMQSELLQSEKLAALGEMSAGIAHEINNPLTGILMFASLLLDDPRLDPGLKKDLTTILGETRRCAEIVRGLLEFSRKSMPRKSLASVNTLLDKTLALVEHQAFFFNIEVLRNYDPSLPQILLDPNQIEQVLMNIILNAAQAMPEGGTLAIETGTREPGHWVCIRIGDNGCGISPEHLEKIFDPFFSTKGAQGTGLGLSVSYGIIENHGGQIEVESSQGVARGTVFTILLPLEHGKEVQLREGNAETSLPLS